MSDFRRKIYLVPILKDKGDVQEYMNYRNIKQISHKMKNWEKVVGKGLREEKEVSEN